MRFHNHLFLTCAVALLLAWPENARAQLLRREYEIKAGVLAALAKCVTWPPESSPRPNEPLKIGILGEDPFFENGINQIDRVVQEHGNGMRMIIKRFNSASDYEPCHILYISSTGTESSEEKSLPDRVAAAKRVTASASVLLVGETPGLTERGISANLVFDRETNLIRLEINPDALAQAGLRIAPDLLRLKVVRIVRGRQS